MIPFWNRDITEFEDEFKQVQKYCSELLELEENH